ncbi:hypothetical protein HDU67_004929, partial [Dinochytrium kinnereticum]
FGTYANAMNVKIPVPNISTLNASHGEKIGGVVSIIVEADVSIAPFERGKYCGKKPGFGKKSRFGSNMTLRLTAPARRPPKNCETMYSAQRLKENPVRVPNTALNFH